MSAQTADELNRLFREAMGPNVRHLVDELADLPMPQRNIVRVPIGSKFLPAIGERIYLTALVVTTDEAEPPNSHEQQNLRTED